ncbi:MAG: beta-ketoacyl synthase N-terminal-like domain-containing protein, partial [Rubricoccaceae bacterium]|nr:beta-ketoacyl synthase N-terminal-like domain-containing protein [Rubricoccaceae bacterium]
MSAPSENRIVVTGLGALTPIGNDVPTYWDGLMQGVSGAGPITHFDSAEFTTHFACELKNFDAGDFLDKKEARRLDPFSQYALVASDEALRDAGIETDSISEEEKNRIGVVFGSGIGGMQIFQDQVLDYGQYGPRRLSPFFVPMMILDIAAGLIAMRHGLRGPNYATVSACATSNNAIADAYLLLRNGYADIMVTGGCEAAVTEIGVGGFAAMRALSTRNDDPGTASRPFDAERDGFVIGEGAGALVLERLDVAQKRGAKIYA